MARIESVGVVGAGQMGNGIAHVSALSGYNVVLNDISQDALDAARETIGRNLDRQLARDLISKAEMDKAMDRIVYTTDIGGFEDVDLAIEAATERRELKEIHFPQYLRDRAGKDLARHQYLLDQRNAAGLGH